MAVKRYRSGLLLRSVMLLLILALLTGVVGFGWFAVETFAARRTDQKSDAIVVLTGGRGRVEEGVRLYRAGTAKLLVLAGVDPSVRRSDLFQDRPGEALAAGVLLEQKSRTTLENALYARDLLATHRVRSITLITSRYHLPRAQLLFSKLLPATVAVYPYPVESRNLQATWWRQSLGIRLLLTECYKYWLFRLLFVFSGELSPPPASEP